jgi:transcriptional regulator with XRE-family HTH domain
MNAMPGSPKADEVPADLTLSISRNLKRLRTRQGLSLERLARRSGVSRAMLGQIELGKSVPTIAVLWRIATALDVSIGSLAEPGGNRPATILRRADARVISSPDGGFRAWILSSPDGPRGVDFQEISLAPRHTEKHGPRVAGTRYHLMVVEGTLDISLGSGQPHSLCTGDVIFFHGDLPHQYANPGTAEARAYVVVLSPD